SGIVHQHPILRRDATPDRREAVLHRLRTRRAATIQRLDAAHFSDQLGVELVTGRNHDEHRFEHDRVVERIDRAPEQRYSGERHILFGQAAPEAHACARGGDECESPRGSQRTPTLAASLANSAAALPPKGAQFAHWGGPAALTTATITSSRRDSWRGTCHWLLSTRIVSPRCERLV